MNPPINEIHIKGVDWELVVKDGLPTLFYHKHKTSPSQHCLDGPIGKLTLVRNKEF